MKLAGAVDMKEMDRAAIEDLRIPSTLLMENAAAQLEKRALAYLPEGGKAAIFAGSGNNGGDGISLARRLLLKGCQARVFLVGSRDKQTPDSLEMTRRLEEAGGRLEDFSEACFAWCRDVDLFIDAMFGTGLRRPLEGKALEALRLMNELPAPVIAADMPSGVDADSGKILGEAVQAAETVTFSFGKPGQFSSPGALHSGRVLVRDIGIPKEILEPYVGSTFAVTPEDMRGCLPRRPLDAHKGDFGRVLILAGCKGFTGAPELAARAAMVSGAGLVSLGVPESIYGIEAVKLTEAMPFPLPEDGAGRLSMQALPEILERLKKTDVCLVGPGLGRSAELSELIEKIVEEAPCPIVLDADGINALAENIDILKKAKGELILTPHEGEFRRVSNLLDSRSRLDAAREFAMEYGVTVLLKGYRTVTAYPDGRAYLNTSGGPALAKGGSGDVLAGMAAAFLAQGIGPEKAVFLHGRAADLYTERFGDYSMLASDLLVLIPETIRETFKD